jgi:hypothetical protein
VTLPAYVLVSRSSHRYRDFKDLCVSCDPTSLLYGTMMLHAATEEMAHFLRTRKTPDPFVKVRHLGQAEGRISGLCEFSGRLIGSDETSL